MSAVHPALQLRRPLRVGARVRVKCGHYKGFVGVVVEALTEVACRQLRHNPRTCSCSTIMGGARYGVALPGLGSHRPASGQPELPGPVVDYARFELVALTRRNRRRARRKEGSS